MFKIPIQNKTTSPANTQTKTDFPVHTMKKDLEEIENPSSAKISDSNKPIPAVSNLNDRQKSSPFFNSVSQPAKASAPIKIMGEKEAIVAEKNMDAEKKLAEQKALETKRLAEEKAAIEATKIAEEKRMAEQKRLSEEKAAEARKQAEEKRIAEQKVLETKRLAEKKSAEIRKKAEEKRIAEEKALTEKRAMEERLAKQKAAMARKMAEENVAKERVLTENTEREIQMAEQMAMEEKRLIEQQKTVSVQKSPTPTPVNMPDSGPQTKPTPVKISANNNITPEEINEKTTSHYIVNIVIAIFVILLIAGGAYYFWMNRQQKNTEIIENNPEYSGETIPTPEIKPVPEPEPVITFLTDKPNYLTINSDSASKTDITTTLKTYADKVTASKITTPIEFIVVDKENNPISFTTFANNFGITLSTGVMKNISDTFTLFIYNDQDNIRFGLSIDSKNDALLKTALLKEEKNIIANITPLFMNVDFTGPTNILFTKAVYNNTEIHYINSTSPQALSVDYAIANKKLLIGTSKMTMRSVIDYVKKSVIVPSK